MPTPVTVLIHPSQFPDRVRRELLESLRSRRVNHKFHYDSYKQTQRWLELHQAYAPSRTDPDCASLYDRGFEAAVGLVGSDQVQLIGLGCGGGQKDTRLLRALKGRGIRTTYIPADVSVAMVLEAAGAAREVADEIRPCVLDLGVIGDVREAFGEGPPAGAARLISFFGMIPNFEPGEVLPKLASLVRPGDGLLFSANLAPGEDYEAGVRRILPLYDNPLTAEWLLTFLFDLGVERQDGGLEWEIEAGGMGRESFLRVAAYFQFSRPRSLLVQGETFAFATGERIRLFFSYRYGLGQIRALLLRWGLAVTGQWIARSEEEGVFLCEKA